MVHLQQQKFAYKLLNDICSDYTDKDCILLSVNYMYICWQIDILFVTVHILSVDWLLYKWG